MYLKCTTTVDTSSTLFSVFSLPLTVRPMLHINFFVYLGQFYHPPEFVGRAAEPKSFRFRFRFRFKVFDFGFDFGSVSVLVISVSVLVPKFVSVSVLMEKKKQKFLHRVVF